MHIQQTHLKKIPHSKATDILSRYQQDRSLKSKVSLAMTPVDLINLWLSESEWQPVITFLCHALPVKECIWWGYQSLVMSEVDKSEIENTALTSVELWLKEPSEPHRRRAELTAQQAELDNACGLLAQAVFWSGGSITPLDGPECPAPDYLHSHTVAAAIYMSAIEPDPTHADEKLEQRLALGIRIADGGY